MMPPMPLFAVFLLFVAGTVPFLAHATRDSAAALTLAAHGAKSTSRDMPSPTALPAPDSMGAILPVVQRNPSAPLSGEIVEIRVPAEDLPRCLATLEQVFVNPLVDDAVQSVSLTPGIAGPTIRCVVK